MTESYSRHDISDQLWLLTEPHITDKAGCLGRKCERYSQIHKWRVLDIAYWCDKGV